MRRLLNFGVSDPLTLGMAHPVADRLETLGRARPATLRTRILALGAMSVMAIASAPFSIAGEHPETNTQSHSKARYKFMSSINGKLGQSYEIVTEDGEKKAYQILEGGDRKEVPLTRNDDGSLQLTYEDGQVIEIPYIDGDELAGLGDLKELKKLKFLKNLKGLEGLEGLDGLKHLNLMDLVGSEIRIFSTDDETYDFDDESFEKFPEDIRKMLRSKGQSKSFTILHDGETRKWLNQSDDQLKIFALPDTVVDMDFDFLNSSDPLDSAQHQLDIATQKLEALAEDENLSYDLKNALRDIESARRSLEEAEKRQSTEK